MSDLETALHQLANLGEDADFDGPQPAERVKAAERALCVTFPNTYREFLQRLGCGSIGSFDIYGIVADMEHPAAPNVVWATKRLRDQFDLPTHYVPVVGLDDASAYALDCDQLRSDGECPVVRVWLERASGGVAEGEISANFAALLTKLIALVAE